MSIIEMRKVTGGEIDLTEVLPFYMPVTGESTGNNTYNMLHVVSPGSQPNFAFAVHPVTVGEYKQFLSVVHPDSFENYTSQPDDEYVAVSRHTANEYLNWLIIQATGYGDPPIKLDFPTPEQNAYVEELVKVMQKARCYRTWMPLATFTGEPCWHSASGSDVEGLLPSMPTSTHPIKLYNNQIRQILIVMKYPKFNRAPGWR